MEQNKILITSTDTKAIQLPGVISMPDGKKPLRLGSGSITTLISSGGMAIVYEIWNSELEVKRAVKLLKPDHTPESEDRFHMEMKITAKLHHPNIVEIYSVGKWNDQLPYIEMELIDGFTLEKIINETGCLPPEVCTSIGIMVGRALNYAHNQSYMLYGKRYQGVIHRDLKPGNIMVANDGVVKLMDFGIAKPITASLHTIEGVIMGTMQYLAPEQLDAKEVDARADLYSLGLVLYEILTGTRAFGEQNLGKLVTDKLNNSYVPLNEYSAKIPQPLCNLIQRLIRCEKEKRVQDVLEFLRAICAIHKTLTLRAPEQVIEQFMKNGPKLKRTVLLRGKKSVIPSLLWACGGIALTAIGLTYGILNEAAIVKVVRPYIAEILHRGEADVPAPAQPDPSAVAKRIDSILEKQKALTDIKQERKPALSEPVKDDIAFVDESAPAPKTSSAKPKMKSAAPIKKALASSPKSVQQSSFVNTIAAAPIPSRQDNTEQQRLSLVDKLKQQYRTSDVMSLFSIEVEAGKFSEALQLYSQLPLDQANSKKAKIYRLRALRAAGGAEEVKSFFTANDIYDGEFYLEKAQWFFNANDLQKSEEFIKRASVSPSQFLDQRQYREQLLYARGIVASARYDRTPSAETKKAAMEAWFEVKSLFRTSPDHRYFQKADAEIRRISAAVAVK